MPTNLRGRPYDPAISQALFQAAERVMEADGFSRLSVDGIVTEVGTTRPAFYRRYQSMSMLVLDVLVTRFGSGASVDTGSLASDLLKLQRDDIAMMTTTIVQRNLPGLFEAIRTDEVIRSAYLEKFIGPRRRNVANVIRAAIERREIDHEVVDVDYICDMLFGPILSRVLLPTKLPINDELARRTVDAALRELAVEPGPRPLASP